MADGFVVGQRWISEGEPDLGLGSVLAVGPRTVTVAFAGSRETRTYALDSAPLQRVRFRAGDQLRDRADRPLLVVAVRQREGLLVYVGADRECCETELSHQLSFSAPEERMLAGQGDPPERFSLRASALELQFRRRRARVRGFLGGRIELLGHQLDIAAQVTARMVPRVLLADEVGLGKTIEACLILHRLLATGRARRVLILLPESLIHQWFVELLRRFNLWFHIFDEERCQALESAHPGSNPFLDDQLLLCSLSLLSASPERLAQALAAGWDLLVVDEAHHLAWTPAAVSSEYRVVEQLGAVVPGLLLLTATPEQLGAASHFARLRLLDPERFSDLASFTRQSGQFRQVAALAERLLEERELTGSELGLLAGLVGEAPARIQTRLRADPAARAEWLGVLLDQHGTGRVLFRNTRATVTGFPAREVHLAPLAAAGPALVRALEREFQADLEPLATPFRPDFAQDPRLPWLADLLRATGTAKVLLICRTRAKLEAIDKALRPLLKLKTAQFHEGLSLVQRDRAAAWFAEPGGARLLLCSEIGSEGRNFQFAHHLVLFDLPLEPDLLEQRIGRLDRIGQAGPIHLHVPFLQGSPQELLAQWYHQGLNAFQENLHGGRELLERFRDRLLTEASALAASALAASALAASADARGELLKATRAAREELAERLRAGRDRLLELNSCQPERAAALVREIRDQDEDPTLDRFLLAVFEHFSVQVEELGQRSYQLGSMGVLADSFPGLPAEGLTLTTDRQRALVREDIQFLTWDHPLVSGALDLLLSSGKGNCCFSRWPDAKASGLYLEALFLLEVIAPPQLHADRFLAPTPVRVLVDHRGAELGSSLTRELLAGRVRPGDSQALLARPGLRELLARMLEQAKALAGAQVPALVAAAQARLQAQAGPELERLRSLSQRNGSVPAAEIEALRQQFQALRGHLQEARLRLDAVHLVHRTRI